MSAYSEALSIMYWDMRTGAPKKGIPARSEAVGTLSSELFQNECVGRDGRVSY